MSLIFVPLMLQRPTTNSRAKQNIEYLTKRLAWWSEGDIDKLMNEGRTIQERLKASFKQKEEARSKAFCRLMLQGKVSKALNFIDSGNKVSGVLSIDGNDPADPVLTGLKEKHPIAHPVNLQCVVNPPSEVIVEPVIFEDITADLIAHIARDLSGSGGPTKVDADGWKHFICNKSYSSVSDALCQSIADLTKRFCRDDINPSHSSLLLSCRLIPLNKNPGIRPIGIGEVLRRIMAKAVTRVLRKEIQLAGGTLQTCTGIDGGIEAAIHGMAKAFDDEGTEALILVDADNAFNRLNRKTAMANIKTVCPPFATFLNNIYKDFAKMFIPNTDQQVESQEGTTQGCPAAFDMYALSIVPLITYLATQCKDDKLKQAWFADDSSSVGTFKAILKWWNLGQATATTPKLQKHGL